MSRTPVLAPSLVQLRREINNRWPGRSKASDGWIGDTAHQRGIRAIAGPTLAGELHRCV